MAIYKRILLAVDLTENTQRLAERAKALADTFGAELRLIHVLEPIAFGTPMTAEAVAPLPVEAQQELIGAMKQKLQSLAASLGLPTSACSVELGNVKVEIPRVAKNQGADLIVLGSRERRGLSGLVDFTEDTVLHKAPCDVLAVRV